MADIFLQFIFVLFLALGVTALPQPEGNGRLVCPTNQTSLPQIDCNATARAQAILVKRQEFLYGPSLIGNASFFPTGNLAQTMIDTAIGQFEQDETVLAPEIDSDLALAEAAVFTVSYGEELSDSPLTYPPEWRLEHPCRLFWRPLQWPMEDLCSWR